MRVGHPATEGRAIGCRTWKILDGAVVRCGRSHTIPVYGLGGQYRPVIPWRSTEDGLHRWTVPLLCLLLPGIAAAADDAYRVGPRDVLHVEVYGEEDCTREVVVSETGRVTLPYVGTLEVGGRTLEEVANHVTDAYRDGILLDPEVAVRVVQYRSKPYQVLGAVKKPGVFYLERPLSVREAVGEAGWIDTATASRQVSVRGADGTTQVFSLEELAGGAGDRPVRAGDVISVQEGQWVYVSGEVTDPGEVPWYEGLTAWQALARAGGPEPTARLRRVVLLREGGERLTLNLKRVGDGKEPDVPLRAGDRLLVRQSLF